MKENKKSLLLTVATLLVMVLIFAFSSRSVGESVDQSTKITRFLCKVIFFHFDEMSAGQKTFIITELDYFVRKLAHFSIYMLLGACSYSALLFSDVKKGSKWLTSLAVCAMYASLDEIHQYFIPGRSMRITDVMIDSAGALAGIIAVRLIIIIFGYISDELRRKRTGGSRSDK